MNKFIAIIMAVMIMIPSVGFAQTQVDLSDLSEKDRAEILLEIAVKKESPAHTLDKVAEYAQVGEQYGKAIAATAKELGIAANDFLNTPAGLLTAGLIVWKIAGDDLLGVVGGLLWFSTMIPLWVVVFWTMLFRKKTRGYREQFNEDGKVISTVLEPIDWSTEKHGGTAIVLFIILALICISGFFMFFG